MPKLALLLEKLFGNTTTFFAGMFDSGIAFRLALITIVIGMLAAFYAAINTLFSGISAVMPSAITAGASWLMPTNFDSCLAAVITGHLLAATYRWHRDFALLHQVR